MGPEQQNQLARQSALEGHAERPETRLLKTAARIIATEGLQKADLRRIVSEAKTSNSQLHAFYGSRDGLLVQVFDNGWRVIEQHIVRRVFGQREGVQATLLAIIEAVFDAFEEQPDAVGATVILGLVTIGDPVREELKKSAGFGGYRWLGSRLFGQLDTQPFPEGETREMLDLLFGALLSRLFLLTPLCAAPDNALTKFNRKQTLRVFDRMLSGLLAPTT